MVSKVLFRNLSISGGYSMLTGLGELTQNFYVDIINFLNSTSLPNLFESEKNSQTLIL